MLKLKATTLAGREARLAYIMLAPTFIIVFAIVLFPVIANFWISFKSVKLANLRPPTAVVRERIRETPLQAGDSLIIRYQMRNSSQDIVLNDVLLSDSFAPGLTLLNPDERCSYINNSLSCNFGSWDGGYRENLEFEFSTSASYFETSSFDPLGSKVRVKSKAPNILTNFDFTFNNFIRAFKSPEFWPTLRTTLWYTIFGTIGSILLGLFAAQLLNTEFAGKGFIRGLFLFPYVAPIIAVAFTWAFLLDPLSGSVNALGLKYGLFSDPINFLGQRFLTLSIFGLNFKMPLALTSVILFEAWRYFPFAFLFILARFQAIPTDIYEAADVDGAGSFQKFRFITLPQLIGILSTLFLLRFIWTFNKFDDIFLLTGGAAGTKTLTVQVYDQAFALADLGAGAAVAVILFVILLIFMATYFYFAPEGD